MKTRKIIRRINGLLLVGIWVYPTEIRRNIKCAIAVASMITGGHSPDGTVFTRRRSLLSDLAGRARMATLEIVSWRCSEDNLRSYARRYQLHKGGKTWVGLPFWRWSQEGKPFSQVRNRLWFQQLRRQESKSTEMHTRHFTDSNDRRDFSVMREHPGQSNVLLSIIR